ncbi:MAG: HNH endonuclease family protein [Kiritimatiellae bacterium]|nr:HNH endonuclease family protein [Kiritimatiellia bacterium]
MLAVSSGEQQRWVLEAYRNASGRNLGDADFLAQLKVEDRARNPIGDADAFKSALRYPAINRYWFWRLDYILWELYQNSPASDLFSGLESGEKAAISAYRFKANRSIEHVHPQTSTEPWQEEDLHAFGNLAMISASFNSAQSNDGVGTKFGRIKDQLVSRGALESIKMLLMFKAADRSEANWSEETANRHGKAMIDLLLRQVAPAPC